MFLQVFNPKSTADRILGCVNRACAGTSLVIPWVRYGELYRLIEEAEQGVSKEEGDAMKASFESDAFAVDQLIVYMRQVRQTAFNHYADTLCNRILIFFLLLLVD